MSVWLCKETADQVECFRNHFREGRLQLATRRAQPEKDVTMMLESLIPHQSLAQWILNHDRTRQTDLGPAREARTDRLRPGTGPEPSPPSRSGRASIFGPASCRNAGF